MLELFVNISFVKCFFLFSGIKYTFYSYVQGTGGYFSHQIILMLMESGKQKLPPLITFLPDHFAISKYEGRVSWGLLILSFSWISRKPFLFHVIKACLSIVVPAPSILVSFICYPYIYFSRMQEQQRLFSPTTTPKNFLFFSLFFSFSLYLIHECGQSYYI